MEDSSDKPSNSLKGLIQAGIDKDGAELICLSQQISFGDITFENKSTRKIIRFKRMMKIVINTYTFLFTTFIVTYYIFLVFD